MPMSSPPPATCHPTPLHPPIAETAQYTHINDSCHLHAVLNAGFDDKGHTMGCTSKLRSQASGGPTYIVPVQQSTRADAAPARTTHRRATPLIAQTIQNLFETIQLERGIHKPRKKAVFLRSAHLSAIPPPHNHHASTSRPCCKGQVWHVARVVWGTGLWGFERPADEF